MACYLLVVAHDKWPGWSLGNVMNVLVWDDKVVGVRKGHLAGKKGKLKLVVVPMPNLDLHVAVDKWQGPGRCVVDLDSLYEYDWQRAQVRDLKVACPAPIKRRITNERVLRPGPNAYMTLEEASDDFATKIQAMFPDLSEPDIIGGVL